MAMRWPTRASRASLNARDAASEYIKMGGDTSQQDAADSVKQSKDELEALKTQLASMQKKLDDITR